MESRVWYGTRTAWTPGISPVLVKTEQVSFNRCNASDFYAAVDGLILRRVFNCSLFKYFRGFSQDIRIGHDYAAVDGLILGRVFNCSLFKYFRGFSQDIRIGHDPFIPHNFQFINLHVMLLLFDNE